MREIGRIEAMGVKIVTNHRVADVLAEKEAGDFDAVFIAIGANIGKHVDILARDAVRVLDAVSLCMTFNLVMCRVSAWLSTSPNRSLSCVGHDGTASTCQQRLWPRLAREPAKGGLLRCRQICRGIDAAIAACYFAVLKGVSPEIGTTWRRKGDLNSRDPSAFDERDRPADSSISPSNKGAGSLPRPSGLSFKALDFGDDDSLNVGSDSFTLAL